MGRFITIKKYSEQNNEVEIQKVIKLVLHTFIEKVLPKK